MIAPAPCGRYAQSVCAPAAPSPGLSAPALLSQPVQLFAHSPPPLSPLPFGCVPASVRGGAPAATEWPLRQPPASKLPPVCGLSPSVVGSAPGSHRPRFPVGCGRPPLCSGCPCALHPGAVPSPGSAGSPWLAPFGAIGPLRLQHRGALRRSATPSRRFFGFAPRCFFARCFAPALPLRCGAVLFWWVLPAPLPSPPPRWGSGEAPCLSAGFAPRFAGPPGCVRCLRPCFFILAQ